MDVAVELHWKLHRKLQLSRPQENRLHITLSPTVPFNSTPQARRVPQKLISLLDRRQYELTTSPTYLNGREGAHAGNPAQVTSTGGLYGFKSQCVHSVPGHWIFISVIQMECRDRMPGCASPPMCGNPDVRRLWPAAVQGMVAGRWADGVVVLHLLSMRGALGSIPPVSTFGCDASPVRLATHL